MATLHSLSSFSKILKWPAQLYNMCLRLIPVNFKWVRIKCFWYYDKNLKCLWSAIKKRKEKKNPTTTNKYAEAVTAVFIMLLFVI